MGVVVPFKHHPDNGLYLVLGGIMMALETGNLQAVQNALNELPKQLRQQLMVTLHEAYTGLDLDRCFPRS